MYFEKHGRGTDTNFKKPRVVETELDNAIKKLYFLVIL